MLKETIAKRYSAALYALAIDAGSAPAISAELDSFVAALHQDSDLATFFASPVIERDLKIQILERALASRISELALHFLILLVRKRREGLLDTIARQLHALLDATAGREAADIAAPAALSAAQLAELARRLSSVYGRTIIPKQKVEPELLGGLVVQVGDRYVDASVAGKLEELRRHLLASEDTWGLASPNGKGTSA